MTKKKLITEMALKLYGHKTPKYTQQCEAFCDALKDVIEEAWLAGDRVVWENFFSSNVVTRKARRGRNPVTNKIEMFPEQKTVVFNIHPNLKRKLNNGGEEE